MHAKLLTATLLVFLLAGCSGNGAQSNQTGDPAATPQNIPNGAPAVDDDRVAGPPVCALTPKTPEGSSYADTPHRPDLAGDSPGVSLTVQLKVVDVTACDPIEGATVALWHADAGGAEVLRGTLTTTEFGVVTFQTIYPGTITARAPHVNVKITRGAEVTYVGQLFFPEDKTQSAYEGSAYGISGATNASDPILSATTDRNRLMLHVIPTGRSAYLASITIGVDGP